MFRKTVASDSTIENRRKKKKTEKNQKAQALGMTVKTAMNQPERKMPIGTQVKRDGLAITVKRRDISHKVVLKCLSPLSPLSSL